MHETYVKTVVNSIKEIVTHSITRCKHFKFEQEMVDSRMNKIHSVEDLKTYVFEDMAVTSCLTFTDYKNITVTLDQIGNHFRAEIYDVLLDITKAL